MPLLFLRVPPIVATLPKFVGLDVLPWAIHPARPNQYVHVGANVPFTSQTKSREYNHTQPIYAQAMGLDHKQFNYLPEGQPLPFECK